MNDILIHYGMPRRSGRYPWGSGEDPYQHGRDFLGRIEELKKTGWTETPENIKKEFGLSTTQYRAQKGLAKDERRMLNVARAKSLKEDGLGDSEIARKISEELGRDVNESTVRSWLNAESESRMKKARETADFIREQIDKKGMIDVGAGVSHELNISKEKLDQALAILEAEGYPVYGGRVPQVTNPAQKTTIKVVCPPGTEHKEIYNYENIHSLNEYISRDGGDTYEKKFHYPESMDSKRLMIRYKEDGGVDKDGVIELRRNVPDLSLGESRYSQVRILVDGDRYLKGMALYSDDMPDGIDVIFNTNKSKDVPMRDVLKKIKDDPDNPFGSAIKDVSLGGQYWYDPKTGERVSASTKGAKLGLINKRADEGDWTEWKDALPSQFLAKQSRSLAKKQLDLAIADKTDEYNEISSLTNPTIKKHLLMKYADECDSAAVHLQAAALPGQKYHVIIPITSMKDTEVYAPNYENGTELALIRYPHGGTFEIPILKVNNKQPLAKKLIGTDSIDAVGINSKVAERLSGADFDGDTVMCIPTNDKAGKVKIISTPPLKGLEGFDPKTAYPERKGMKYMKDPVTGKDSTQMQMGVISNLITDMTLKGATQDELARAVRHSMVVIDAGKHKLDYKQSEIDNNIASLKKKYQTTIDADGREHTGGASTLLSRSKGEVSVLKRQGSPKVNLKGKAWYDPSKPEGSLVYQIADDVNYEVPKVNRRTGEVTIVTKQRTQRSTKMAETDDAKTLISDANTPMERLYADYANRMKDLANRARVEAANTGKIAYSKTAKATYSEEVRSLDEKLRVALMNAPRERQAQLRANAEVNAKVRRAKEEGRELKNDEIKKAGQQALSRSRADVNSVSRKDRSIKITDREWEAIQSGAISENVLKKILNNADIDELRQRATPRSTTTLNQAKINRIKAYSASNYTLGEIAKKLGVSVSTVSKYLKE
ncbi:MAG: helix-turn-helix transcriptional regulator [Segatella copri]